MDLHNALNIGFTNLVSRAGLPIRIRYFTSTAGSVYNDDVSLSLSGTTWASGIVFNIDNQKGSIDSVLVEQGKILTDDIKLFILGAIPLTGSELTVTIGIGSPTRSEFTLQTSATGQQVSDNQVYKKVYLRKLELGSLIGQ